MIKKYSFIIPALLYSFFFGFGQTPWVNEIHNDNTGTDTNEGVEVAGAVVTDSSTYSLTVCTDAYINRGIFTYGGTRDIWDGVPKFSEVLNTTSPFGNCGSETFTNSNAAASYSDNNFIGDNGITWSYVQSRNGNGDANGSGITLPALMLRRAIDNSKVTSSSVSGGIEDFSVKLYKGFTGGGSRQVELFINGISQGTSPSFDDYNEHIFTVNNINISGDIIVELRNITSNQIIVDDITWTCYTGPVGPEIQLVNNSGGNEDCGVFDLDFGNIGDNDSTQSITFDINNLGSSDLTVSSITNINTTDFTIISPTAFPIVINPGGTESVTVLFNGSSTIQSIMDTLTIISDDSQDGNDETSCDVTLSVNVVNNLSNSPLMITQYYEGVSFDKWIEITNISAGVIPDASIYYLASYNQSFNGSCNQRPLGGLPTNSIALPAIIMQPGDVIRLCEPTPNGTIGPSYAAPSTPNGPTGNDGDPTYYMFNQSFSGDDIIILSTTDDVDCYNNRIDIIGEYSVPCGTTNWGEQMSFVRKEVCSTLATTSITFDSNDWIEYAYNDPLIASATPGTNEYIGQHFQGITTFISGSWDNGLPNNTRTVVISENYDTSTYGSFESCSLTINSNSTLDIKDGDYVSIETNLLVGISSTLDIQNEGQLIMVDDTGNVTNSGTTNINKTTATMQPYDYVYWSSPIDYGPPLPPLGIAFVLTEFMPNRMYRYNTAAYEDDLPVIDGDGFDDDQNDWVLHSSFMDKGIGYATMTANTTAQVNNAIFSGKVNNGIINVNLSLSTDVNTDADGDEDDWNLIGNPYPSAISADSLVSQNLDISGTLYFWTHNTEISISNPGPDAYNFSTDDYAMYNFTGGVGTGTSAVTGGNAPTGNIASGQGFFVDAINDGTVTFNNSMRSKTSANDDFFRNSENAQPNDIQEKDRFWLNLTNPDGAFSQVLVGFFEDATFEKDRIYDGVRLKGTNYVNLYTMDNTSLEYGIQGRPTFDSSDIIPLGYSSNLFGTMQIELSERNGILLDETIYLKDKYLFVLHDLTISPYVYSTEIGSYNDRFEIVFEEDALGIDQNEFMSNELTIIDLSNGNVLFKVNGGHQMGSIEITDLLGRTLYVFDGEGEPQRTFNLSNLSQETYIASVTLTDGHFITKKAVKRN